MYLDSKNTTFRKSPHNLSSGDSANDAVSTTLAQIYSDFKSSSGFVMYNDQDPDGTNHESRAHSKGVAGLDTEQGFWMIHSVPSFPNAVIDGYEPCCTNGLKYGQSFLCLTLPPAAFNRMGCLGRINWPHRIDSFVPEMLRERYPDFSNFADGGEDRDAQIASTWIETVGGRSFEVFAKSGRWGGDLYDDLIAPGLGVNLQVSTWQNGVRGAMGLFYPTDHRSYTVVNVVTQERNDTAWKESQDHSKWAITYFPRRGDIGAANGASAGRRLRDGMGKWVCVGDINRMASQMHRGGGTACIDSPGLWSEFEKGITTVEECSVKYHGRLWSWYQD